MNLPLRRHVLPSGEVFFEAVRVNGDYRMDWPRAGAAVVDGRGRGWRWIVRPRRSVSREVLSGIVGSYAESLAGRESLHATVLMKAGRCLAFLGDSGAGKSTFAAGWLKKDPAVRLVTDDVLRVRWAGGRAWAGPVLSSPRLKLDPSSPFAREPWPGVRSRYDPNFERSVLFFPPFGGSVSLEAAVLLRRGKGVCRLRRVRGARAAWVFLRHFYNRLFLPQRVVRAQFRAAADLTRVLPLWVLDYSDGERSLPAAFARAELLWN